MDWHQEARANPLFRQYQLTLDAILRDQPKLQPCAVQCCHCGIRFLTHPRNAGRRNLRCPFGCREHHRRQCGNERSRRHYQSNPAKRKKKLLNGKRSKFGNDTAVDALPVPPSFAEQCAVEVPAVDDPAVEEAAGAQDANCNSLTGISAESAGELMPADEAGDSLFGKRATVVFALPLEGFVLKESALLNSSALPYAGMVTSLILQRTISREELLARLRRRMRQHSMGRLSRREYVLHYLNQHPP